MSQGILSTYAASSNREDLSPKKKPEKRKRVAYNTKGRAKSTNIEDRRGEKMTLDALTAWLEAEQNVGISEVSPTAEQVGEPPFPLPRPKKAPIPKTRPKGK